MCEVSILEQSLHLPARCGTSASRSSALINSLTPFYECHHPCLSVHCSEGCSAGCVCVCVCLGGETACAWWWWWWWCVWRHGKQQQQQQRSRQDPGWGSSSSTTYHLHPSPPAAAAAAPPLKELSAARSSSLLCSLLLSSRVWDAPARRQDVRLVGPALGASRRTRSGFLGSVWQPTGRHQLLQKAMPAHHQKQKPC